MHSQPWTLGACRRGAGVPVALETKLNTTAVQPGCPVSAFALLQSLGEAHLVSIIQTRAPTNIAQGNRRTCICWEPHGSDFFSFFSPCPFGLVTEPCDKLLPTFQCFPSGSCCTSCPVDLKHLLSLNISSSTYMTPLPPTSLYMYQALVIPPLHSRPLS